jgi:2-oxoglutarate dehydrogenase E2 component (dihydrolipoamide succinyltransferase)
MPIEIVVPDLGESVLEATVGRWLKQEGDHVTVGEALVELETDKVNLEVGAEQAGVLAHIERAEGDDVRIGDVLGVIEEVADNGASPAAEVGDTTVQKKEAVARDKVKAKPADKTETGDKAAPTKEAKEAQEAPARDEEKATPVARRLAQKHGVDLTDVPHDSNERLTRHDVESYLEQRQGGTEDKKEAAKEEGAAQAKSETKPAADRAGREERVRMSRRRQTIARRLVEAQQTAAMLTTFNEIDMGAVMELRQRRRDSFLKRHGIKLGFMSFFVKASVGALKQFPQVNAEIDGNEIVLKHYYDIGMAIGAEEGLVVPVIRDADRLTFAEIEQTIEAFVQKSRDGSLSLDDLRGGTFTITNGGVFGSLLSTPILNPPQVGILGLHKIEERPIAQNGEIVIRPMMYVALSYDHRIVDGREAVQFLVRIKELIEDPETLLLEG